MCRVGMEEEAEHEMGACPMRGSGEWEKYKSGMEAISREMFGMKRFAQFAGCYICGLPQAFCNRWAVVEGDGGRFQMVQGGSCQYKGVLIKMFIGLVKQCGQAGKDAMKGLMRKDGIDIRDKKGQYKWLGRRACWGQIETNEMYRVCLYLSRS